MYYTFVTPCNQEQLTVFEDHYDYAAYDLFKLYQQHALTYRHTDECYKPEYQEEEFIQENMIETSDKP